jgi:Tfp pilus assembly protein PilF
VRVIVAEEAMRTRDHARAIEQYRAVLEVRPADVLALNNLAWLYQEAGDPRALPLAREAARLAPQSAAVGDTLGWLLVQKGQVDEGLKVLQVAVGQKGANEETHYHYAVALARKGSSDEARTRLQQLLREPGQFPSRPEAEELLRQLSAAPKKAS